MSYRKSRFPLKGFEREPESPQDTPHDHMNIILSDGALVPVQYRGSVADDWIVRTGIMHLGELQDVMETERVHHWLVECCEVGRPLKLEAGDGNRTWVEWESTAVVVWVEPAIADGQTPETVVSGVWKKHVSPPGH